MAKQVWMSVAAMATMISAVVVTNALSDEEPTTAPSQTLQKRFQGEVLSVTTEESPRRLLLKEAQVKQLGDAWFITGKSLDAQVTTTGETVWTPLREVRRIVEYASVEKARADSAPVTVRPRLKPVKPEAVPGRIRPRSTAVKPEATSSAEPTGKPRLKRGDTQNGAPDAKPRLKAIRPE